MKIKLRIRKLLTVLLCLCMLFTNISSIALADDGDDGEGSVGGIADEATTEPDAPEGEEDEDDEPAVSGGVVVTFDVENPDVTSDDVTIVKVTAANGTAESVKVRIYISGSCNNSETGAIYPVTDEAGDAVYVTTNTVELNADPKIVGEWRLSNRMNKYLEFTLPAGQKKISFPIYLKVWEGMAKNEEKGMSTANLSYTVYPDPIKNLEDIDGYYRTTDEVTLLTGNSTLRGDTLQETINNYNNTFLLGVAADFCVFLKEDFEITASDAEGRVAVGGDIIVSKSSGTYSIGAGDYVTHVPLDELLVDRLGAATIILGGELRNADSDSTKDSYLSDVYYEYVNGAYNKFEGSSDTTDGSVAQHQSPKLIVLNMTNTPGWLDNKDIPSRNDWGASSKQPGVTYAKMDRTQTFVTELLDFDTLFGGLTTTSQEMSEEQVAIDPEVVRLSALAEPGQAALAQELAELLAKLVEQDPQNSELTYLQSKLEELGVTAKQDDVAEEDAEEDSDDVRNWIVWEDDTAHRTSDNNYTGTIWFIYGGDTDDEKDCVYFNLSADDFECFQKAKYIKYVNIPKLPEPRDVITNEGEMVKWDYSYIVVNIGGEGEIHLVPDIDSGNKVTTINNINISLGDDDSGKVDNPRGQENNYQGVTSLMYNFYEAGELGDGTRSTIVLGGNFQGTIFAPGAHVTDEATLGNGINPHGHLSGALIANSFKGATEFGYRPFSGTIRMLEVGELTISKTVVVTNGNLTGDDKDKIFTFTVTLTDDGVTGDFPAYIYNTPEPGEEPVLGRERTVKFINGEATVRLKHGQSITIKELPVGVTYKVEEIEDPDYSSNASSKRGTIRPGETATAEFVNTRTAKNETGSLTISKTVTAYDVDGNKRELTEEEKNQAFTFTITLDDKDENAVSGSYSFTGDVSAEPESDPISYGSVSDYTPNSGSGTITFIDGVATVYLAHNQSITITGLPEGTTYTVTETAVTGYTPEEDSFTGTIDDETATSEFVNTKNDEKEDGPDDEKGTGDLTVSKTVSGNAASTTRKFTFTVTLSDKSINGTYGDMTFVNGVATFTLKHGESVTAKGLPAGITYTVKETDNAGYTVTKSGDEGRIRNGKTKEAKFINTKNEETKEKKTGSLTVSKTVTGKGADLEKEFTFTVTLSDTSINGIYGGMKFVDGVATVTLKHGESVTATGLPAGITYTVEESDNAGYTVTKSGDEGTIENGKTKKAKFTNTKDEETEKEKKTGGLTVSKTVTGEGADLEKEFTFTVTLSDTSINGTYGGMTFVDGVATVTLKHGESVTATGLPAGITYTVEESDNADYTVTKSDDEGTIENGKTKEAKFINTKDEDTEEKTAEEKKSGSLTVSKTVTGEGADLEKEFTFTVTLSDTSINGIYGGMTFVDGVAVVTLKHGESMTATGLPAGITYTVTETAVEGYTSSATGATGTITSEGANVAAFINKAVEKYDDVPQTGDDSRLDLWLTLMTLSLAGIIALSLQDLMGKQGKRIRK